MRKLTKEELEERAANTKEGRSRIDELETCVPIFSLWIPEQDLRAAITEMRDLFSNTRDFDTQKALVVEFRRYRFSTMMANMVENGMENRTHMGVMNDVGRIKYLCGYVNRIRAEKKKGPQPEPLVHTRDVLLAELHTRKREIGIPTAEGQADIDWKMLEKTQSGYEKEFKKDPTIDHERFVVRDYFKRVKQ